MAFNRLIAYSTLSDINRTLKIGITIKWSLKLHYVVAVASLWLGRRFHITMSFLCQYLVGQSVYITMKIQQKTDVTTMSRDHCYTSRKRAHMWWLPLYMHLWKGRNADWFFFTFIQIVSVSMPHLVFIEWRYKAREKRCKVIDEWLRCMTVICVNCPILLSKEVPHESRPGYSFRKKIFLLQ